MDKTFKQNKTKLKKCRKIGMKRLNISKNAKKKSEGRLSRKRKGKANGKEHTANKRIFHDSRAQLVSTHAAAQDGTKHILRVAYLPHC